MCFLFRLTLKCSQSSGKKKKKKRINLSLLRIWSGFWGSCGLGDSHKFISKMTTTAECCHLSCELLHIQMIFQELQVSSYAKHKCLAQLPQDQVVAGIDARPHHFLRRSSAPGPYLIAALVSLFLSFGEHDVCLVTCQKGLMNWSGNNESKKKKNVFSVKSHLSSAEGFRWLVGCARAEMSREEERRNQHQRCCWQCVGRGGQGGRCPHQPGPCQKEGDVGQGAATARSWQWQPCCCKPREAAGSAEGFHLLLSVLKKQRCLVKRKKKCNKEMIIFLCVQLLAWFIANAPYCVVLQSGVWILASHCLGSVPLLTS